MVLTTASLFLCGCATTGPFKEFSKDIEKLSVGMTESQVHAVLGQPESTGFEEVHCGEGCRGWDYRRTGALGQDLHLTVFFKSGRVVGWREWRPALNL